MWPISRLSLIHLLLTVVCAKHFDEEFGFEILDKTGCDLVLWSADNKSPCAKFELPENCVVQYPTGLLAVPVLNSNQSCFLYVNSDEPLQIPQSINNHGEDEMELSDLWVETFQFNNHESMNGMVIHINQDTSDAKLYNIGKKIDKKGPTILVLRLYQDACFVSLVEEIVPVFTGKTDSVTFKLQPGDLIVFLAPSLVRLYNDIFDLVGVFSEFAADDPIQSFDDVRKNLQSALHRQLTLIAIRVK